MANIIWSFGIALTADDQASERISGVLGLINQLDESLNRLNARTVETSNTFGSLGTGAAGVATKAAGGFGLVAGAIADVGASALSTFLSLTKVGATALLSTSRTVVPAIWSLTKGAVTAFSGALDFAIEAGNRLVGVLQAVPDVISRWVFGRSLDDLRGNLIAAHKATKEFVELGAEFYPLDQAIRQVALHGQRTGVTAGVLADHLTDVATASGLSMAGLTDLSLTLARYGENLNTITSNTVDAGNQMSRLERLGQLADTFGLGASGAAMFSASLKRLGLGLVETTDKAAEFETKFGVPGLMQVLPEVTRHATDAISRFGKNIVGDEKKIIENTLRTGATFSKAFGKDIHEATTLAVDSFSRFSDALEASQDVMLGLRDDFSPLQSALFQYGVTFEQTQQLLKQGRDDPLAFAENIRKMSASMDPTMARRFISQISKELPEGIRNLVRNENDLKAAVAARAEAQEMGGSEGGKAFEKLTTAMRDNARDAIQIFENIKGAVSAAFGILFADDIRVVFQNLVGGARSFATQLRDQVKTITSNQDFIKIREVFRSVATALVGVGEASGVASKAVGVVSVLFGLLTPLATTLDLIKGAISSIGPRGELTFGGIVKGVFKSIIGFETLSETISDIKTVLGGTAQGWDKFTGVGRAVIGGFAKYVNKIFFGLPDEITKKFYQGTEAKKGVFGDAIINLFSRAHEATREQLVKWRDAFLQSDFVSTLGDFGKNVGSALGNITKTVGDWVSGLFDEKKRAELLAGLQSMFSTTAAEKDSIAGSLLAIGGHVFSGLKTMGSEFADAFLAPFGTNLDIVFERIKLTLKGFALTAEESFDTVRSAIFTIQEYGLPVFKVLTTVLGIAAQGILALAAGFVGTTSALAKGLLFMRSLLPESLGGISKEMFNQSYAEVDNISVAFKEKIGSFSNTVTELSDKVNAFEFNDLGEKREELERRARAREAGRVGLAGDERKLREKEIAFKMTPEALLKDLKIQLPGAGTSADSEFDAYSKLDSAINSAATAKDSKREAALRNLMDDFRQAAIRKQAGDTGLPIAPSPDKPSIVSPTKVAERTTVPTAASSAQTDQQKRMMEEFMKFLKLQQLTGKVTVELKGDDFQKQYDAWIKGKPM